MVNKQDYRLVCNYR